MEDLGLGSQVEPALHKLGNCIPLIDLRFLITSLILQRQTGANMVAVLENLSTLVSQEKPPRRFIAGADAVGAAEQVAATLQQQTDAYRELSSFLAYDNA